MVARVGLTATADCSSFFMLSFPPVALRSKVARRAFSFSVRDNVSGQKFADAVGNEKALALNLVPLAERNAFDFPLLGKQVKV
jgi:hypothetical protein